MANTVLLKKSSVASRVPNTSDLEYGELAINYTDGKLYFKNSSNQIDSFLSTAASSTVSSVDGNTGDVTSQQIIDAVADLTGIPEGDFDLGTFTGAVITDNTTIKTALQELETAVENAASASNDPNFDVVARSGTVTALLQPILQSFMLFDDYTFRTQTATIVARSGTLTVTG